MLFQLFSVSFVVLLHILSNTLSVIIALAPRSHCEANSHIDNDGYERLYVIHTCNCVLWNLRGVNKMQGD